jgi:hypothetical protein
MPLIPVSDETISELIAETKPIPDGLCVPLRPMSERNGHWQKAWDIECDSGNRFVVKIRMAIVNPMNFSVILGYVLAGSYTVFRLRRYNGKSHYHTNVLENEHFYDFHVHLATERYQIPGFKEDHFAERTVRYYDLASAVQCLLNECGFRSPLAGTPLFPKL